MRANKLRSIVAQMEYSHQIYKWTNNHMPFTTHLYVPETHPLTWAICHEREDEGHLFNVQMYTIIISTTLEFAWRKFCLFCPLLPMVLSHAFIVPLHGAYSNLYDTFLDAMVGGLGEIFVKQNLFWLQYNNCLGHIKI